MMIKKHSNKRRSNKRRSNKRRSNKRRSNKRRSNKCFGGNMTTAMLGGIDSLFIERIATVNERMHNKNNSYVTQFEFCKFKMSNNINSIYDIINSYNHNRLSSKHNIFSEEFDLEKYNEYMSNEANIISVNYIYELFYISIVRTIQKYCENKNIPLDTTLTLLRQFSDFNIQHFIELLKNETIKKTENMIDALLSFYYKPSKEVPYIKLGFDYYIEFIKNHPEREFPEINFDNIIANLIDTTGNPNPRIPMFNTYFSFILYENHINRDEGIHSLRTMSDELKENFRSLERELEVTRQQQESEVKRQQQEFEEQQRQEKLERQRRQRTTKTGKNDDSMGANIKNWGEQK